MASAKYSSHVVPAQPDPYPHPSSNTSSMHHKPLTHSSAHQNLRISSTTITAPQPNSLLQHP